MHFSACMRSERSVRMDLVCTYTYADEDIYVCGSLRGQPVCPLCGPEYTPATSIGCLFRPVSRGSEVSCVKPQRSWQTSPSLVSLVVCLFQLCRGRFSGDRKLPIRSLVVSRFACGATCSCGVLICAAQGRRGRSSCRSAFSPAGTRMSTRHFHVPGYLLLAV